MDELSKDPEFANDIFKLLSKRLKEAKTALQAAEEVRSTPYDLSRAMSTRFILGQENKDLRKRVNELQDNGASNIKDELRDVDMLTIACRLGQCGVRPSE